MLTIIVGDCLVLYNSIPISIIYTHFLLTEQGLSLCFHHPIGGHHENEPLDCNVPGIFTRNLPVGHCLQTFPILVDGRSL